MAGTTIPRLRPPCMPWRWPYANTSQADNPAWEASSENTTDEFCDGCDGFRAKVPLYGDTFSSFGGGYWSHPSHPSQLSNCDNDKGACEAGLDGCDGSNGHPSQPVTGNNAAWEANSGGAAANGCDGSKDNTSPIFMLFQPPLLSYRLCIAYTLEIYR